MREVLNLDLQVQNKFCAQTSLVRYKPKLTTTIESARLQKVTNAQIHNEYMKVRI